MKNRYRLLASSTLIVGAAALSLFVAVHSASWIGAQTPGFFVDPTRQISLLTLPGWPTTDDQWPAQITAVDGVRAKSAGDVYQAARSKPEGSEITYETTRLGVRGDGFQARSRRLATAEFTLLFLGLIANGFLTILIAATVWCRHRESAAASAFLIAGAGLGFLAITSVAAVSMGSLARVQILAQTLAAAGILHLAAVFPRNRLGSNKVGGLFAIYTPFTALAFMYQLTWPDPYGGAMLHAAATFAGVGAAILITASLLLRLSRHNPIIVRRRAAIALTGIGAASKVALAWTTAAGADWRIIPAAVFASGSIITLAFAAAISGRDFFTLDERLREIVSYASAVLIVAALYFGALYLLGVRIAKPGTPVATTMPFAILNVLLLFAVAPLVRGIRAWVNRVFSPETYSPDRSLAKLNHGLSSARTTQTMIGNTLDILRKTLAPRKATVFLRAPGRGFALLAYDDPEQRKIPVPTDFADLLESGENAVRYQWDDGSGRAAPHLLDRLDAELLVPMYRNGSCVGVIALAAKRSAHPYDTRDIAFIRAAATQIALALPNAAAQDKLDVLHKNLEELNESMRLQTNRTETLKAMNAELGEALDKLRDTHHQLIQNQQEILRAERLTALTRLSVGLTQEISGPLATVLNALQGIAKIGKVLAQSPRDPRKQDTAIGDMIGHAQTSAAWLERTIAYLRSFQALARGASADELESFAVRDSLADVTRLLRLRLRQTACTVDYDEGPDAVQVYGSRQRFELVLVDLISGAIEAYEEDQIRSGRISVEAERTRGGVSVSVIDWAGGINPAAIPRLLEQLGSDDPIGNRRGLWIAKNLIEEGFGGTLEAFTNEERVCFTAIFPAAFTQSGPMPEPPSLKRAANDA